ncbi:MAG: hypothetical protein RR775_10125 [Massilia sp.]|uniref:hypothetical protein n=1 Tax=Massilia sp. TaxID=1882437 RepID=UPI002FC9593B
MTNVVVNGNAYSDDGSAARDMRGGGVRSWLLPMTSDTMQEIAELPGAAAAAATEAATAVLIPLVTQAETAAGNSADSAAAAANSASDAAGSAATASGSAGEAASSAQDAADFAQAAASQAAALSGTSTTSVAVGAGAKTFTTQTGKQFTAGMSLKLISQSNSLIWMAGDVTSYNSATGALVVEVVATSGSGTLGNWKIAIAGVRGATGLTAGIPREARTSGTAFTQGEKGKLIDITSGTFTQGFSAAAVLGDGWFVWLRNSGAGVVTLDPNGTETIDGVAALTINPGETRLIQCDGLMLRSIRIAPARPHLHVRDVKASGTSGGGAVGTVTRTLNTTVRNTLTGASLSSDQITLPAGAYTIDAVAPAYKCDNSQAWLYSVTDATDVLLGTSARSDGGNNVTAYSHIRGSFTLSAQKTLTIRQYTSTFSSAGLGAAANSGKGEVYTDVNIWRDE